MRYAPVVVYFREEKPRSSEFLRPQYVRSQAILRDWAMKSNITISSSKQLV